jgi:hypothetical protein
MEQILKMRETYLKKQREYLTGRVKDAENESHRLRMVLREIAELPSEGTLSDATAIAKAALKND